MLKKIFLGVMVIGFMASSCNNDDEGSGNPPAFITPQAGLLSGGPFTFCIDGEPDMVSGITTSTSAVGTNRSFVITDSQGNILGLPPDLAALEGVDFDDAGGGTCLIWYLRYEDGLQGAEVGMNTNELQGSFSFSNSIEVIRNAPNAGSIVGGPFNFTVDGTPDFVSGISVEGNTAGTNITWVITDDSGNILGLPPTRTDLQNVDFDAAGAGVCLIWYLRYEDGLQGLEVDLNINNGLLGCYSLSNSITVTRN